MHRSARLILCACLAYNLPGHAGQSLLGGTVYEEVALAHGVKAELLYAVTLRESRRAKGVGKVMPWPWAIRTPAGGAVYADRSEAAAALASALERWSLYEIDVGLGQINLGWQSDRYDRPAELLDPRINLEVSAAVLAEALASTEDPALAVGRYHTWSDPQRAREYGTHVLAITERVRRIGRVGNNKKPDGGDRHASR